MAYNYHISTKDERYRKARKVRRERLKAAKLRGDHNEDEWIEMLSFFNHTCAMCFTKIVDGMQKDHIEPLCMEGSNSIYNLQPLCYHCNPSKGTEAFDYRLQLANYLNKRLPQKYRHTENYVQSFY